MSDVTKVTGREVLLKRPPMVLFGLFGDPSDPSYERIVLSVRMPRIILCILTGASLGLAGAVMQGLLRNPLVSPFTLGVSTAASFGAAMAIVFGVLMSLFTVLSFKLQVSDEEEM